MNFHRSKHDEPWAGEAETIEPESIGRLEKWTAISCTVIVVAARILWGMSH
jgi:hypothetical protein